MFGIFSNNKNGLIEASHLKIKREAIFRAMLMDESQADEYILQLTDNLIVTCKNICLPKFGFFFHEVTFPVNGKAVINGIELNIGKLITKYLQGSQALIVFACTIGEKVENFSKEFINHGNSLEGLLTHIIGSELVEAVADNFQNQMEFQAQKRGFNITNRYSPGYCNWNVNEQQKLFSLLGDNNCGIKLTESSLMIPIKSVSGIIGVGGNVQRQTYKCNACDDEQCPNRRLSKL